MAVVQVKYPNLGNMYELLIFQGFKNLVFYWDFKDGMAGIVNNKETLQVMIKEDRI